MNYLRRGNTDGLQILPFSYLRGEKGMQDALNHLVLSTL